MSAPALAEERGPWDRVSWQPGSRSLGWWGMVMFIATEAMVFALLIFVYFFLRAQADQWPLGDVEDPKVLRTGIRSLFLFASSATMHAADAGIRRGSRARLLAGVGATLLLAAVFFAGHLEEAHSMWVAGERPDTNAYTSAFWTIVNFHAFHLLVGMLLLGGVMVRGLVHRYDERRHIGVQLSSMYWHFVDVVWVFVFASLYLSVAWL